MTREQAINWIQYHINTTPYEQDDELLKALDMAISALENIGHLKDRPCSVCEFRKENGCCKWTCVFCDSLFGDMR